MPIVIDVKIVDSIDDMEEKVLDRLRLRLNSVFKRAAEAIRRRIQDVCQELIMGTEEYQEIINGPLLGELGIPDVKPRLDHILSTIRNGVQVVSTPLVRQGKQFGGGLVFKMIRSDFLDILELPDASYVTDKGTAIPWLNWMLLQGDTIIVIGYDVRFNLSSREKRSSRTGLALMEKGTGWRVPPAYSGTAENNFITRAFVYHAVESLFLRIIEDEISSRV